MRRVWIAFLLVFCIIGVARADCATTQITVDENTCVDAKFNVTTTRLSADNQFSFSLSAVGIFYVDWGDGSIQTISRDNTTNTAYSHTYTTAGVKIIRFGGVATGYTTVDNSTAAAAISFRNNTYVAGIDGSLGAIFPTLANGSQPRFYSTFSSCTNLTSDIPEELFDGIYGAPVTNMFRSTFYMDSGLTGSIPSGLFRGLNGPPASGVFYSTFNSCSGLTGSIPADLFAGLNGAPAENMFYQTFYGCSGLTGSIPGGLFRGIVGAPATSMFKSAFYKCSGLSGSIPGNLFSGISGPAADSMYYYMFGSCSGLTGYVPPYLFSGITSGSTTNIMRYMFYNTGLVSTCPSGTTTYTTGWESYFSGSNSYNQTFVACTKDSGCEDGYLSYNGNCYQSCRFAENLHIGTLTSFSMFAELPTSVPHSIVLKMGTSVCYVPLESGTGQLNIEMTDGIYHAVSADTNV